METADNGALSMSAMNWVLLGAMLAWTPGLLVLAWLVARAPLEEEQQETSPELSPTATRPSTSLANLEARVGLAKRSEGKQTGERELTAFHVDG